jgi:hypothetical protein
MEEITDDKNRIVYKKLAPYLPGLYSVQAIGPDSGPGVTVYRSGVKAATSWLRETAARKEFVCFLLRHALDKIDLYGRDGACKSSNLEIDEARAYMPEQPSAAPRLAHDELEYEARGVLDETWSSLAYCECRADVSSASHSNFAVAMRGYVLEAEESALEHLALVESALRDYRTLGLYARVAKLPARVQDAFLDSFRWLTAGWPTQAWHYKKTLAYRLCHTQKQHLADIVAKCFGARGHTKEYCMSVKLHVVAMPDNHRHALAETLVERLTAESLDSNIEYPAAYGCEVITDAGIAAVADVVIGLFTSLAATPIANK